MKDSGASGQRDGVSNWRSGMSLAVVILVITGGFFLSLVAVPEVARGNTLYVGGSGPGNYTTIQSAVNAAGAGDTVFVYAGTYPESVTLARAISLRGQNISSTIIDAGALGNGVLITANGASLSGFTVSGSNSAVYIDSADNTDIENATLTGSNMGVLIMNSRVSRIANVNMSNNAVGLGVAYSDSTVIEDSSFTFSSDYAIASLNATGIAVRGSDISNNTGLGGMFLINASGVSLTRNTFRGNFNSILLAFVTDALIDNNTVASDISDGFLANPYQNVRITNNVFTDCSIGIDLVYSIGPEQTVITGNRISANTWQGIYLAYDGSALLANNTISDNREGIFGMNTSHTIIRDNSLTGNDYGISTDSSGNLTVTNNLISANSRAVGLMSTNYSTFANNTVSSSNWGVSISNSDSTRVDGNLINASGIDVLGSGHISITNNTLSTGGGISTIDADWTLIANNSISRASAAVQAMYGSYLSVLDNKISRGDVALHVIDGIHGLVTGNNISENVKGIWMSNTSDFTFAGNTLRRNQENAWLASSAGNLFYHNNFIANGQARQVRADRNNTWDDGYPSGGNYWSDYGGSDNYRGPNQDLPGSDGIGDTPYNITYPPNRDRYPLMSPVGTEPVPPMMPRDLGAVPGDGLVNLSWRPPTTNGSSPLTGYRVYRGVAPGSEIPLLDLGTVLRFTDSGVANGQTYYYRISAMNAIGESAWSDAVNATPNIPPRTPGPPTNLAAVAGDGHVALTWSRPSDSGGSPITGFRISRGTTAGGETPFKDIANVTAYDDTGLTNGQTYYYTIAARNAGGLGASSNEASATPRGVPGKPVSLTATAGSMEVVLGWQPPTSEGGSPITNYLVYRGQSLGGEIFLKDVGDALAFTDTGLTNGVTYYYAVTAKNAIGEGAMSAEASATPATVAGAPTDLTAVAGDGEVTLSWASPTDDGGSPITGYVVLRGETSATKTVLASLGIQRTYVDRNLTNGMTYYYAVAAVNAVGRGMESPERNATPTAANPRQPPIAVARCKNQARVGETLFLDGTLSTGDITNYTWTIRDANGMLLAVAYGVTANHTFSNSGYYTVTLYATDEVTSRSSKSVTGVDIAASAPGGGSDWPLILILIALVAAFILYSNTEVGRVALLTLLVAPIHGRKKGKEETESRGMIRGYITGNPGDTFTDIKKALDLQDGALAWHLMKLIKEGIIKSSVRGSRRCYYPAKMPIAMEDGGDLHELQRRLLHAVEIDAGKPVTLLAEELGVSRQLALYHLRKLGRSGRLTLERRGLQLRVFPARKRIADRTKDS